VDQFVGKFDKHFLVGYFLSCLLFVALNLGFEYLGLLPFKFLSVLSQFGLNLAIILSLAVALFLGVLLAALNRPIIMLYEGYPLRICRFLVTRQRQKWHRLHDRRQRLMKEYDELSVVYDDPKAVSLRTEITQLITQENNLFPPEVSTVLPTRLGNAIRAFERHTRARYGIEPITLWSRLLAVLPSQFLEQLAEVTTSFNFLINTVLLLQLFAVELFVVGVYSFAPGRLVGALGSAVASYLLYRLAISRAIDWGFLFRAAFDLYRRDLLKKFGLRPPPTIEEERDLWRKLWLFLMYQKSEGLEFDLENAEKKEDCSNPGSKG
jgi:hypothetical protein